MTTDTRRSAGWSAIAAALLLLTAPAATAQAPPAASAPAPPAPPYGNPITLDQAKIVIAKAEAEARRLGVAVTIAVAEPSGTLVAFQRMDGATYASAETAPLKARSAAMWKRPTASWVEAAKTSAAAATLPNVIASPGGEPILLGGRVIGGVGVGGNHLELQIAATAAAALQ